MKKIAILISGRGTNMSVLADRVLAGDLRAEIAFVASDHPDAQGVSTARAKGLLVELLPYREKGRSYAEEHLAALISSHGVDLLILAGFMRILSPDFVSAHAGRIVNIHPSLLPSFPGTRGILDAWNYGVRITGVTVHLVDEKVDHGPILSQEAVYINNSDSLETLEEKIHKVEHALYWRTIKAFIQEKITPINRRRTSVE